MAGCAPNRIPLVLRSIGRRVVRHSPAPGASSSRTLLCVLKRRRRVDKMVLAMMSWLLAIPLLGAATGLRSLTPMAVLCWFAYLGYLPVGGTWAGWTTRLWVVLVFTLLAAGENAADKSSWIPDRIAPAPLLARLVLRSEED